MYLHVHVPVYHCKQLSTTNNTKYEIYHGPDNVSIAHIGELFVDYEAT